MTRPAAYAEPAAAGATPHGPVRNPTTANPTTARPNNLRHTIAGLRLMNDPG